MEQPKVKSFPSTKYVIPQQIATHRQSQRVRQLQQKAFILLGIKQKSDNVEVLIAIIGRLVNLQNKTTLKYQLSIKEAEILAAKQTLEKRQVLLEQENRPNNFQSKTSDFEEQIKKVKAKISIRKELKDLWYKKTENQKKIQDLQSYLKQIQDYLKEQQNKIRKQNQQRIVKLSSRIDMEINESKQAMSRNLNKGKQYENKRINTLAQIAKKKKELIGILAFKKELKREILQVKSEKLTKMIKSVPRQSNAIFRSQRSFSPEMKLPFTIVSKKAFMSDLKQARYFIFALICLTILIAGYKLL